MERLAGETSPRRLVRGGAPSDLAAQLGAVLARIHALDPDDLPPLPVRPAAERLAIARELLDRAPAPRPAAELGLRWAADHAHPGRRRALVHGDFRTSNYAVGPDGRLTGVFDWEFSHIGDPVADLAFLCLRPWRFGAMDREVSGIGDRADLYAAYEAAGGDPVDPEAVRFWEVVNLLAALGVFSARAADPAAGGSAVEGAAIGRRVAELEHDLLALLD
jgi:aminoglycoside phosphotransferase (APT) family kinase protein